MQCFLRKSHSKNDYQYLFVYHGDFSHILVLSLISSKSLGSQPSIDVLEVKICHVVTELFTKNVSLGLITWKSPLSILKMIFFLILLKGEILL